METKTDSKAIQSNSFRSINRLINVLGNIFLGAMVLLVAMMVFCLIQYKVAGGPPRVAGHLMYIVLSDSMNPAFRTGSLAFVKPARPEEIAMGDIITFKGLGDKESLTTHRVVEIDGSDPQNLKFITRGDANDVNDPNPVPASSLVGKVSFALPYFGYLLSFGQTKQGLVVLIIMPGALLIISEIHKLYNNLLKLSKEKNVEKKSEA